MVKNARIKVQAINITGFETGFFESDPCENPYSEIVFQNSGNDTVFLALDGLPAETGFRLAAGESLRFKSEDWTPREEKWNYVFDKVGTTPQLVIILSVFDV